MTTLSKVVDNTEVELYVGIDQSFRNTAITLVAYNRRDKTASLVDYRSIQTSPKDEPIVRMIAITQEIYDFISEHKVKKIFMEGLAYGNIPGNSNRDLAGLYYLILCMFYMEDYNYEIIAPTSVKKKATGNGKATKEEMFLALPAQARNTIKNLSIANGRFDVADAYHIATVNIEED